MKSARLLKSLQIERSLLSLCCKTKTNTPLMYEVLDKDTIKNVILPHLSVAKRGYATKSNLAEAIQYILYRLKNGLSVAHNEEKVKNVSLCFLCSYVKSGRVYANTREKNVCSKSIERCRTCSNIVMPRKRTFRGTRKEQSTRSLVHLSSYQPVHSSTYQLLSTFQW